MATSLETNAVVTTRVLCIFKHKNKNNYFIYSEFRYTIPPSPAHVTTFYNANREQGRGQNYEEILVMFITYPRAIQQKKKKKKKKKKKNKK